MSKSKYAAVLIAVGAVLAVAAPAAQADTKTVCITKKVDAGLGTALRTKFCKWFRYDGQTVKEVNPISVNPEVTTYGWAIGLRYGGVAFRSGEYQNGHRTHWGQVGYRYESCVRLPVGPAVDCEWAYTNAQIRINANGSWEATTQYNGPKLRTVI